MTRSSDARPGGRAIRSYVRRNGRITSAQQRALSSLWEVYALPEPAGVLDLPLVFARHAPVCLEIGSGDGESIVSMAEHHRENDYIAVEVHRPGLGRLLNQVAQARLDNVRVAGSDVNDVLDRLPDQCLSAVYIFFPDPWPKKKHRKRRLLKPAMLSKIARALKRSGRLYFATDCQAYADELLETLGSLPGWVNLAGPGQYAPRLRARVATKFERRGIQQGHAVVDLILART